MGCASPVHDNEDEQFKQCIARLTNLRQTWVKEGRGRAFGAKLVQFVSATHDSPRHTHVAVRSAVQYRLSPVARPSKAALAACEPPPVLHRPRRPRATLSAAPRSADSPLSAWPRSPDSPLPAWHGRDDGMTGTWVVDMSGFDSESDM